MSSDDLNGNQTKIMWTCLCPPHTSSSKKPWPLHNHSDGPSPPPFSVPSPSSFNTINNSHCYGQTCLWLYCYELTNPPVPTPPTHQNIDSYVTCEYERLHPIAASL